jgi:hypothetical protein
MTRFFVSLFCLKQSPVYNEAGKTAKKTVRVPETPPSPAIQDNDGLDEPTESEPNQELTTTTNNNPTQTQTQTQALAQAQELISRDNTTTQTPTQTPTQIQTQTQSKANQYLTPNH